MKGKYEFVSSPYHYRTDETLPCVGDKLSEVDVVKLQKFSNDGVERKVKTGMEGCLVESYLVWASRRYGLVCLRKPDLNARRKRK